MIWRRAADLPPAPDERGQAALMVLALVGAVLARTLVLLPAGGAVRGAN